MIHSSSPSDVERLLHHMPAVAQQAGNEWAKGFASSVVRQSRRRGWTPSQKQTQIMRRMVSELFTHSQEGGDIQLIE